MFGFVVTFFEMKGIDDVQFSPRGSVFAEVYHGLVFICKLTRLVGELVKHPF